MEDINKSPPGQFQAKKLDSGPQSDEHMMLDAFTDIYLSKRDSQLIYPIPAEVMQPERTELVTIDGTVFVCSESSPLGKVIQQIKSLNK